MRIFVLIVTMLALIEARAIAQPIGNLPSYADTSAAQYLRLSRRTQDQNQYAKAKGYAQKAVDGYTHLDQPDSLGEALVMLWSSSALSGMPYPDRIPILERAATAFEKSGNHRRQADCLCEMADLQQLTGNFSGAFLTLQNALQLFQSVNYPTLQHVYDLLCFVSCNLDEPDEAVRYGLLAIRNADNNKDTSLSLCTYYNHLGIAYYNIRSPEKSLQYYTRSLDVARKFNDPDGIVTLTFNIVRLYIGWKKYERALSFLTSMLSEYPSFFRSYSVDADENMLAIYDRLHFSDSSMKYSNAVEKELDRKDLAFNVRAMGYLNLIYHYYTLHDFGKSTSLLSTYSEQAQKMNIPRYVRQISFWKFTLDSAEGRYINAIRNYEKYQYIGDTMFTQTKSRQIEQYNALYESEKKDKNILLLRQQSQMQDSRLRQQSLLSRVTLAGIMLLIIITGMLYYTVRVKQRSNRLLEAQRAEIDRKNTSLQQLVTEKEWLVKEIHHRVKNNLHMVVGLLASQAEYLKGLEAYNAITESQHRIQAMSLIHQKLYNTENLSSIDMPHYVQELVEYLQNVFNTGYGIRFALDIAKVSFPLTHSIPIGLILNEAITNAIKYAFPDGRKGLITICLQQIADAQFSLTIRDDGIGIPAEYRMRSSLGISLMEGLSNDVRGNLAILNENGTLITLNFTVVHTTMTN